MLSLNATLDNLIALVVVLLALSLVVQSVQAAVKKAFKLKSRQIEDSLAHLFQFALHDDTSAQKTPPAEAGAAGNAPPAESAPGAPPKKPSPMDIWAQKRKGFNAMLAQSPFLRVFCRWLYHPAADPEFKEAANLYNEVVNKFRGLGRTAFSTRPIFDSLAKNDLLKMIADVDPKKIDPAFGDKLTGALGGFREFYELFREWESWLEGADGQAVKGFLTDADRAKLADLQAKFKPLLDDISLLLSDQTAAAGELQTLAKEIAALRAINLDDVQAVVADVRASVIRAAERAKANNQKDVADSLDALAAGVRDLAEGFAAFRQKYNAVFARWVKLEQSFDTVMQSFEERYTRGMKTAALVISFLVVVFLNANFFKVYQDISTSDTKRELILQSREEIERALGNAQPGPSPASSPDPNETPAAKAEREKREKEARDKQTQETVDAWFRASKKQIDDSASTFIGYGFAPITWHDTKAWWGTLWAGEHWGDNRKKDLKVLLGWSLMALLLSVGAPFWQDTLESLFGVKNLLRKKSDTKNVEGDKGGQPRT